MLPAPPIALRRFGLRRPGLRCLPLLFAAAGLLGSGCVLKPGYVDSTTGRAYAGFAKPACYGTDFCGTHGCLCDLLGVRECDCRRDPYTPPVVAFCSFPGLSAGCRKHPPRMVTTHVHAPMPARYDQFPGHANRFDDRRGAARPGMQAPAAPAPSPLAAPMPLPASIDVPELNEAVQPPGLPPVGPDGIGEGPVN
ncbi:hypothetical protein [Alienimonas californiensis]|uniref:Uncharacterized protein n=1 Tax=Alienimonas californiensis TaxID=2527989 RepID=A0A517P9R8_9PLAN|nr:hypothetical protein [Alienimonas californiensis]QDT16123.1 hypothetical protein CA12_22210 [Alienimonas californiensis]